MHAWFCLALVLISRFFLPCIEVASVSASPAAWGVARHQVAALLRGGALDSQEAELERKNVFVRNDNEGLDRRKILILDVDNTLYEEMKAGVERQIVRNTFDFCEKHFGMTKTDCDEYYRQFGSTVEGLKKHRLQSESMENMTETLHQYYSEVYGPIDFSGLARYMHFDSSTHHRTGYDMHKQGLLQTLQSANCPIYLASNSPRTHVMSVLAALGLQGFPFQGLLTPDFFVDQSTPCQSQAVFPRGKGQDPFPTKASPNAFYEPLLHKYPSDRYHLTLIDDSQYNLAKAHTVGINGIHLVHQNRAPNDSQFPTAQTMDEAMHLVIGHVSAVEQGGTYKFSEMKYLRQKNQVDIQSINVQVWNRVREELSRSLQKSKPKVLRIADLGAGLLLMLELVLHGLGESHKLEEQTPSDMEKEKRLPSLLGEVPFVKEVHYHAYESNSNLVGGCRQTLERLGFTELQPDTVDSPDREERVFYRAMQTTSSTVEVKVYLKMKDFTKDDIGGPVDLVMGCCFADLCHPQDLIKDLQRFTRSQSAEAKERDTFAYFPITFAGTTCFDPPQPFCSGNFGMVPSDTAVMRAYAKSLVERQGHHLDPTLLVDAFQEYGGTLLEKGSSPWFIHPSPHPYLWRTMMYFFAQCGFRGFVPASWDMTGWFRRALGGKAAIYAYNMDLFFRMNSVQYVEDLMHQKEKVKSLVKTKEIQFTSPRKVSVLEKSLDKSKIGPSQVEVTSICSLISSGTELKVFKGLFDEAALDVNIKEMADASMSYPLAFGYSLVGIVTRCGSEVTDGDSIVGKLVFAFSPHATHVILDRDSVHLVPEGISPEDAMFFPAVETAVSLVHDANVRVGERVAVWGQGLIGLLVTSILSMSVLSSLGTGEFGSITVFDNIPKRLAMASSVGATEALLPSGAADAGPFDVAIEVSGNGQALQSAFDSTKNGGKVVIGSWYGNSKIALKLGIEFHRSHKTFLTSQVSEIPAALREIWTKKRRFALTWELLRLIKPSKLLSTSVPLEEAQKAYESLECGDDIAIAFRYN